ncbi:hypothetical protein Emed_003684 [Eimeria media]
MRLKAASVRQHRAQLSKTWWPVLLSVILAVLFILSLCRHSFVGSLPGIRLRQLGESEEEEADDAPKPSSPDFTELCHALGEWIPGSFPGGGPRESPDLVQAVLASIEVEADLGVDATPGPSALVAFDTGLEASVSHTSLRRLLLEEDLEEEGRAGPSSKIARTHGSPAFVQTPPSQSMPPGVEGSATGQMLPVQPSAFPASVDLLYDVFLAGQQPTTSSSTAPAIEEGPSASSETPGAAAALVPQGDPPRKHPFVRLPALKPGVTPLQFSPNQIKDTARAPRELCAILSAMRVLFLKPELDLPDTYSLVIKAQDLARLAYARMTIDVSSFKPIRAADYMARRFMTLWSLYSASQVLKQDWIQQPWWQELVDRIPTHYSPRRGRRSLELEYNFRLILDLIAAINRLKSGISIPDNVVIDLKRRIFCLPTPPGRFKSPLWDPWRSDDQEPSD